MRQAPTTQDNATSIAASVNLRPLAYGLPRPEGVLLSVRTSQFDLAVWFGVSRQRINFAVQQLKGEGLILSSYSTITVVDMARLTTRASV